MVPQTEQLRRSSISAFSHLGALGLFFLAIIDSSPIPTFCGPDLLTIILVATRPNPWSEYAAVATAGSMIGACITYRLAQKAGHGYIEKHFRNPKVAGFVDGFKQSGTGALIASCAIPFPFPTSVVFAAAGASEYGLGRFVTVVAISRGVRYTTIALLAHLYGRHLAHILLHPGEHWGWYLILIGVVIVLAGGGFLLNRRLFSPRGPAPAH